MRIITLALDIIGRIERAEGASFAVVALAAAA